MSFASPSWSRAPASSVVARVSKRSRHALGRSSSGRRVRCFRTRIGACFVGSSTGSIGRTERVCPAFSMSPDRSCASRAAVPTRIAREEARKNKLRPRASPGARRQAAGFWGQHHGVAEIACVVEDRPRSIRLTCATDQAGATRTRQARCAKLRAPWRRGAIPRSVAPQPDLGVIRGTVGGIVDLDGILVRQGDHGAACVPDQGADALLAAALNTIVTELSVSSLNAMPAASTWESALPLRLKIVGVVRPALFCLEDEHVRRERIARLGHALRSRRWIRCAWALGPARRAPSPPELP